MRVKKAIEPRNHFNMNGLVFIDVNLTRVGVAKLYISPIICLKCKSFVYKYFHPAVSCGRKLFAVFLLVMFSKIKWHQNVSDPSFLLSSLIFRTWSFFFTFFFPVSFRIIQRFLWSDALVIRKTVPFKDPMFDLHLKICFQKKGKQSKK